MNPASLASRLLATIGVAATATHASPAIADPPPPVDVVLHELPLPRRIAAIEYNPLALIIGKVSANIVIVPSDHHALVLSPFFARTTTDAIYVFDAWGNPTQLPKQTFWGYGGEIGYRYYVGQDGPRGLFAGPSLELASITATAQNGSETSFLDYGLAADVGYEALVADRIALSLGGGVQCTLTSKSIPNQQLPAAIYANGGVRPRLLLALGFAF